VGCGDDTRRAARLAGHWPTTPLLFLVLDRMAVTRTQVLRPRISRDAALPVLHHPRPLPLPACLHGAIDLSCSSGFRTGTARSSPRQRHRPHLHLPGHKAHLCVTRNLLLLAQTSARSSPRLLLHIFLLVTREQTCSLLWDPCMQ
jgi:hypothetical protein